MTRDELIARFDRDYANTIVDRRYDETTHAIVATIHFNDDDDACSRNDETYAYDDTNIFIYDDVSQQWVMT